MDNKIKRLPDAELEIMKAVWAAFWRGRSPQVGLLRSIDREGTMWWCCGSTATPRVWCRNTATSTG